MSGVGKAPKSLNVLQKPLAFFSQAPMTGFYRTGYCEVGPDDLGNHSVAGLLNNAFLDFTASRGNDLRSIGLNDGCRWCLCAGRWKEALDFARTHGRTDVVPKVFLESTHVRALDVVRREDLEHFAIKLERQGESEKIVK